MASLGQTTPLEVQQQIVTLYSEGLSISLVGERLGINKSTVSKWVKHHGGQIRDAKVARRIYTHNDQTHAREFAVDTGSKAAEGAGVGAGSGGTLGAIIAAVTATGSVAALAATGGLAAPLVAGPLAAALAGAGAGGLGGGLIGGLIGAGIPKDRAA